MQCHDVLLHAIKSGINLVDTAPWYGHGVSESVLGRGLKGIPRQAYYISTKVARYGPHPLEMFDFTYERTIASVKQSLARLQLDYIDVIQVGNDASSGRVLDGGCMPVARLLLEGEAEGSQNDGPHPAAPIAPWQVHDPEFAPSLDLVLAETLPALRQCQKEGLVK